MSTQLGTLTAIVLETELIAISNIDNNSNFLLSSACHVLGSVLTAVNISLTALNNSVTDGKLSQGQVKVTQLVSGRGHIAGKRQSRNLNLGGLVAEPTRMP